MIKHVLPNWKCACFKRKLIDQCMGGCTSAIYIEGGSTFMFLRIQTFSSPIFQKGIILQLIRNWNTIQSYPKNNKHQRELESYIQ